jgi:hypothetical protein
MPGTSLTAAERETVIIMDDQSDTATVSTYQRRIITRLEKNPLARKVKEYRCGRSVGAEFELPAWSISFRSKARKASTPTGRPENFRPRGIGAVDSSSDGHR